MEALSLGRLNVGWGTQHSNRPLERVSLGKFFMPEMIAALFAERARAESALQSLLESEIAPDRLVSAGVNEGRQVSSISGFRTLSPSDDFGAALADLQLPPEDVRLFGRGLQRGLTLVAARVDRSAVGDAVRRLEIFDPVDLDRGSREWAEADGVADQTSPAGSRHFRRGDRRAQQHRSFAGHGSSGRGHRRPWNGRPEEPTGPAAD